MRSEDARITLDPSSDGPVLIRYVDSSGYRAYEWARLVGVERYNERPCYCVEFLDGAEDWWVIADPSATYEFR